MSPWPSHRAEDGERILTAPNRALIITDPRAFLPTLYASALAAVDGRKSVARALRGQRGETAVVAIGKAAHAMLAGVKAVPEIGITDALVITGWEYLPPDAGDSVGARYVMGGHPVPDQRSLDAGDALLAFLASLPATQPLLVLLSGGASSMVERLPPAIGLNDLARLNRWLLGSGLNIVQMNSIRRAVSDIKGGRLAALLGGRPTQLLMISDVPGDAPHDIGSGPFSPVPPEARTLPHDLPEWIAALVRHAAPMPMPDDPAFVSITGRIVASNAIARAAVADNALALGLDVYPRQALVTEEAGVAGYHLADELLGRPSGLHVWGGEPNVVLPPSPGRGGRCQHFALAAAQRLSGAGGCHILAAGSDGRDGAGDTAGALIDGGTVARGAAAGLDPEDCLARADAGTFLAVSGDLLPAVATGTNVMDLILGLKS